MADLAKRYSHIADGGDLIEVVPAADYDNLRAQCGGMELSIAEYAAELRKDDARIRELEAALLAVKRRLHFVGWPAEDFWSPRDDGPAIPDWRKEIAIIEAALAGSPSRPEIPQVQLFAEGRCSNMMHKRYAMLGCTECSPSRDKNLSTGSALSDATTLDRGGEHG
jgi:hypothetical protein